MHRVTHWFSNCDHSVELDDIGVGELSHDGCLLEQFDFLSLWGAWLQRLDGQLHGCPGDGPDPFADLTKLTRTKLLQNSRKI